MLWFNSLKKTWKISRLRRQKTTLGQRVSADVCGRSIWFESDDVALTPAPEAFAQIMLIPALERRRRLRIDAPLDATWLASMESLTKVISSWWDYPSRIPIDGATTIQHAEPVGRLTALCFSGGVDSFHSLLYGSAPIDCLLFVQGVDIPLNDVDRMDALTSTLRQVASATGKRLVTVRTNVREHPIFRSARWERTHGAALAAIGHLLAPELRQLMISSTFAYPRSDPWGTHWKIDPLWSTTRVQIVGEITTRSRYDKIAVVGGHPLVQQHLHVCWKNQTATGNCSRCEKCLRTMTILEANNFLKGSSVFDQSKPLADLLDALPAIPIHATHNWERLVGANLAEEVKHAVKRLISRRRAVPSRRPWFLSKLSKAIVPRA